MQDVLDRRHVTFVHIDPNYIPMGVISPWASEFRPNEARRREYHEFTPLGICMCRCAFAQIGECAGRECGPLVAATHQDDLPTGQQPQSTPSGCLRVDI